MNKYIDAKIYNFIQTQPPHIYFLYTRVRMKPAQHNLLLRNASVSVIFE